MFRTAVKLNFQLQNVIIPGLWGVCAPSICGPEGVKQVADFNLNFFLSPLNVTSSATVQESSCYYVGNGTKDIDASTWGFM
jgi:hypothetical protein